VKLGEAVKVEVGLCTGVSVGVSVGVSESVWVGVTVGVGGGQITAAMVHFQPPGEAPGRVAGKGPKAEAW
jgi:hypothetical protein